jgi:hypothetical protein
MILEGPRLSGVLPFGRSGDRASLSRVDKEREDDRVSLEGLDPVAALKALLAVDPDAPPAEEDGASQDEQTGET